MNRPLTQSETRRVGDAKVFLSPTMLGALARLSDGALLVAPSPYHAMEVWRTPAGHTLPSQTVSALYRRRLAAVRDGVAILTPAGRSLVTPRSYP